MGCQPSDIDQPGIMAAPTEADLDFTITAGADDFHVVVSNTSSVIGIAKWDFGNGAKGSGDVTIANYVLPEIYTITLTLVTNGGTSSITKDFEQTETDFSIFTDPVYINLSGGTAAVDGKTWVVDSTQSGHFGVGPAAGDWPEWWPANPLQKAGGGAYDDEFNFNINEFVFTQTNHGDNYVSVAISDQSYYSNPVEVDGTDVRVNYNSTPGTWNISDVDGVKYLTLVGTTPLYFGFDNGIVDGQYRIELIEENLIKLSGIGFDANRWYYQLIPKGYVLPEEPKLTFDVDALDTGNDNDFTISMTNVVLPEGQTIESIKYSFGDGEETETTDQSVSHTYMRKGNYPVDITATVNGEDITYSGTAVVTAHHSSWVEYLLDDMVMYTDFGETTIFPVVGQDCDVTIVANPDKSTWPNRSNNCAMYSKTNNQWANANVTLPPSYRFDIRNQHTFKLLVYGTAGHTVLLKMENTDKGGDAWQTGTELTYVIQESNKWEIATFDFLGADVQPGAEGWKWWPEPVSYDVVNDPFYNNDWYNVVRIMYQPGDDSQAYSFYFDDLAGPHVEGLK